MFVKCTPTLYQKIRLVERILGVDFMTLNLPPSFFFFRRVRPAGGSEVAIPYPPCPKSVQRFRSQSLQSSECLYPSMDRPSTDKERKTTRKPRKLKRLYG